MTDETVREKGFGRQAADFEEKNNAKAAKPKPATPQQPPVKPVKTEAEAAE